MTTDILFLSFFLESGTINKTTKQLITHLNQLTARHIQQNIVFVFTITDSHQYNCFCLFVFSQLLPLSTTKLV